jgi:hypothetical protein
MTSAYEYGDWRSAATSRCIPAVFSAGISSLSLADKMSCQDDVGFTGIILKSKTARPPGSPYTPSAGCEFHGELNP